MCYKGRAVFGNMQACLQIFAIKWVLLAIINKIVVMDKVSRRAAEGTQSFAWLQKLKGKTLPGPLKEYNSASPLRLCVRF